MCGDASDKRYTNSCNREQHLELAASKALSTAVVSTKNAPSQSLPHDLAFPWRSSRTKKCPQKICQGTNDGRYPLASFHLCNLCPSTRINIGQPCLTVWRW